MKLFFQNLFAGCGVTGIIIAALLLVLFFAQLWYYVVVYRRVARYSPQKGEGNPRRVPLSLVTVIADTNYYYLEEVIPLLLSQEHDVFEIVLVDLTGDVEFGEALRLASIRDPRINITTLNAKPQFPISNKMALNVAIKAAQHENILLSTTDVVVPGPHWFSTMAAGFATADIVIGYAAVEQREGNMMVRLSNMQAAMRWINSALHGKPYRGSICNLGFTRTVYFDNHGFNHLNLNIGEEDLFVQYISRMATARVILDEGSVIRCRNYGGPEVWNRNRLLHSNAFRYYPRPVKWYIAGELWSRAFFFAAAVALLIVGNFHLRIFAGALLFLRFIAVLIRTVRTCRVLTERRLWRMLPVYDLFSPVYEAVLAVARRVRRTPGLWR